MKERLFFALWPDDTVRLTINQLIEEITPLFKGQRTKPENLHITLVFLGHVNTVTKQCMQQMASTVRCKHFHLTLDTLGCWQKSGILWLGTPQPITQSLVNPLTTALQRCGYLSENRPYHTHVTLSRKTHSIKTLPIFPTIHWQVHDFCLVRSSTDTQGVHYQVIDRWPLIEP